MVDAMLKNADLTLDDINAIAIAAGPGSFTGLRIGIAAVKGLAWAADKPCLGVSTLEAMAQNAAHIDGLIVGAMDARRSQVYNAVFEAKGGELTRLTPDRRDLARRALRAASRQAAAHHRPRRRRRAVLSLFRRARRQVLARAPVCSFIRAPWASALRPSAPMRAARP